MTVLFVVPNYSFQKKTFLRILISQERERERKREREREKEKKRERGRESGVGQTGM